MGNFNPRLFRLYGLFMPTGNGRYGRQGEFAAPK